jgi:hypothetical protein
MNEELPIDQNISVEEKDFPASPKSEDIKIDEINIPSITDEVGNVVIGDEPVSKIEIPKEPIIPQAPKESIEEKVKVKGIETNLPPSVNEMGEIAFGDMGDILSKPEKTAEEILKDEEKFKEGLTQAQKEIFIIGKGGQKMTMFDWLNKTDKEYNAVQSVASALISGTIDLGYGFFTIPARIQDYFGPADTPTAAGKAAKLEEWFKSTWAGELHKMTKEAAHATAIGRLTEAVTEIYGAARVGQMGLGGTTKIAALAEEIYAATKANRLIDTSRIVARASEKANVLNNLTGWKKWTAIGIGGGAGIGYLIPSEDLGTLGEIFGGPTKLDRVTRPLAQDDAVRFFNNQLKFGAENSIFTGIITGGFSIAKGLATQGKEWAFSNNLVERWVDKFASYLRPRGVKSEPLAEEVGKVKGRIESAQTTTKDLMNAIDNNIIEIRNGTEELAQSTKFEDFLNRTTKMIHSGDNVVEKGKIVFKGYNNKELTEYEKFLKGLGVKDEQIVKLKTNFFKIRDSYNNFMNEILQGKNLNIGPKEFSKLMMDRVRNILIPEYRLFTEKSIIPYFNFKPSLSSINEIKEILIRNITRQGAKVLPGDADILVNNILKAARINSETKAPSFKFPQTDALGKKRQILVDLSNNFVDGKFTPTEIIKTKKEFEAFQRFFGAKQDPRISILNVMGDLSEFAAKDKFANNIVNISQGLNKNKQRSIIYGSEMEAQRAFNPPGTPTNWVKEIVPLDIESNLGKLYTNPLNGTFTSKEYADALRFTEKLPLEWLNDQAWYRWALVIPKAGVSTAKTVLSVFAHIKNPLQNIAYFVGTGNIFKDPRFTLRSLKQAINTIQPQMLWKNLPKDQGFYKFLQEERIVGQATDFNETKRLLQTAEIGGERVIEKLLGPVGKFLTKSYRNLREMYLAEDDGFKIINFAAEHDNLRIAYKEAVKTGKLSKMPDDLAILKEAASIVRNALPNYGMVGKGIQALRYSPLGNFPSWTAELFRNSVYIVERSINEIKDPIKSGIGMRRMLGFSLATGVIVPKYVDWSRGAFDFTREQVSAMRDFLFDYEKNAEIAPSRDEDGNILYQNLSSYPFTTITDIIQPVLVGIDNVKYNNLEDPLIKTMMIGLGRGFVDAAQPFVEKSIWYQFLDNVFGRDGLTDTGFRIWNKEAPLSEKWSQAINYGFKTIGLGSTGQMERIYLAAADKPGEKGEKYSLPNELLGIIGFRKVKLDVPERLENKLAQYSEKLNNDMKLFTKSPILKGGETSSNDIISRFILANEQKYKTDSEMQQTLNKAKLLEVPDEELYNKFKEAGQISSYRSLQNDSFKSFNISPKIKGKFGQQYEKLQEKDFNIEYSEPLDADTIDKINDIKEIINGIPLNKNFRDFINPKDWMSQVPGTENRVVTAPLPPQPSPNAQVVQQSTPQVNQNVLPTGLTRSETALLKPEEQLIRLNQRQTNLPTGQV